MSILKIQKYDVKNYLHKTTYFFKLFNTEKKILTSFEFMSLEVYFKVLVIKIT